MLCDNCRISMSSLNIVSITCLRIPLLLLESLRVTLITQNMGKKETPPPGTVITYITLVGGHMFCDGSYSPHPDHTSWQLRWSNLVGVFIPWCLHDWSNPHCLNPKFVPCFLQGKHMTFSSLRGPSDPCPRSRLGWLIDVDCYRSSQCISFFESKIRVIPNYKLHPGHISRTYRSLQ